MLVEEVLKRIQADYQAGLTQADLSKKYNVTQQHIHRLLCGKRSIEKMGVGTFLKMFPRATIHLDGEQKVMPKPVEDKDTLKLSVLKRYDMLTEEERVQLLSYLDDMVRSKNQSSKSIRGIYVS